MKTYKVARSIFGDLGSLKRNQVLNEDDPRIVDNPKAVKLLVDRKLLVEGTTDDPQTQPKGKQTGKGKQATTGSDEKETDNA